MAAGSGGISRSEIPPSPAAFLFCRKVLQPVHRIKPSGQDAHAAIRYIAPVLFWKRAGSQEKQIPFFQSPGDRSSPIWMDFVKKNKKVAHFFADLIA